MLSTPLKLPAIGVVDGVNKVFETASDYRPGTVVPFLNGQAQPTMLASEDGGKQFTLTDAPKAGDDVVTYYIPIL